MLVSIAQAQEAAQNSAQAGGLSSFIPLIIIAVIFYFMLIRPQTKRVAAHRDMVSNLKRGDKIVTAGGVVGKVTKINEKDGTISVEIASDVVVDVLRSTISENRSAQEEVVKQADVQKEKKTKKK